MPDLVPALEITDLSVGYATDDGIRTAVDKVSFSIAPGEFMGLAGKSGCGKSTIAQSILRLLRAPGIITGGEIRVAGHDMLTSDSQRVRELRWHTASIVLQNALTSLNPVKRISAQLKEVLERGGGTKTPAELLEMVDIDPSRLSAFPHELSGGQRQRVVIAMALALSPQLIILDEPTTALDVIVQQEIFVTVKALQQRMGFAVLLITHDLPLLFDVADRIAVMKDGKIVETASTSTFRQHQEHPYSKALLSATPKVDFTTPQLVAARSSVPPPVLETHHLVKSYGRNPFTGSAVLRAVDDMSFRLAPREIVALVGASGSGKSTFGRIVTGLIRPTSGDILVDGHTPVPVSRRRPGTPRAAQMVFQDVYGSLNPLHTIGHHLRRAVISAGADKRDVEARVAALLTEVGLTPTESYLDRRPHELSGGQRQRVGLARALAASPKLLVADEPVSMLDVSIRRDILNLIGRLRDEQGVAVLYITHDVVSAGYIADRIAVMHRGKLVEEGPAKAVLKNPQHDYTRRLIAAVPGGLGLPTDQPEVALP